LDFHIDLFNGDPFRAYHEALNEGEILHWLDFIGYEKNGYEVYVNTVVELDGKKYKAIYSKEYNGEIIWLEFATDDRVLSNVRLLPYFDLKNAEIVFEEVEEVEEDLKTGYGIPEFKVIDIVQKHEVKEDYFGQAYDEMTENVMYFRKCIIPEIDDSLFEMDVIEFMNDDNLHVYGVILPHFPLGPILVDSRGERYLEFSLAFEWLEYKNLGNYYTLGDNLRSEINEQLMKHFEFRITNPFMNPKQ